MKFSARTIQILRNFATIHQAMIFKTGKELKTMADSKSVLAKANINEEIEDTFAIYDMSKFLSAISMFEEPELSPTRSVVEIRQANERINFICAEPSLIKAPPERDVNLPSIDVSFQLKNETINRLIKGLAITGSNMICITGEDGSIFLEAKTVGESKGQNGVGAPTYRAEVGGTNKRFTFMIRVDNFKLLPGDYDVAVSKAGLSHFKGEDVEYWIAVEQNSTFEE